MEGRSGLIKSEISRIGLRHGAVARRRRSTGDKVSAACGVSNAVSRSRKKVVASGVALLPYLASVINAAKD